MDDAPIGDVIQARIIPSSPLCNSYCDVAVLHTEESMSCSKIWEDSCCLLRLKLGRVGPGRIDR